MTALTVTPAQHRRLLDAIENNDGTLKPATGDRQFWPVVTRLRAAGLVNNHNLDVAPAGYEAVGRRASAVAAALIAGDDAYIEEALERVDAELAAVATVRTVPIPAAPAIGVEDAVGNPLHEGDAVDLGEPGQMYAVSHADPDGRGLWVYPLGVSRGAERQVSAADVRKQVFANVAGVVKYVPATPPAAEVDVEDGDGWGQPDGMLGPTEAERVAAPPSVVELDPTHPSVSAAISGRVFALTRGLKVVDRDSRYRMRAARVGARVVDLHNDAGDYLATIIEAGELDWHATTSDTDLGHYGAFAAAVEAVRAMADCGDVTPVPDPYAEPPAAPSAG